MANTLTLGKVLRSIIYWVLPFLLIYIIFSRIDINALSNLIAKANIELIVFGASLIFIKILLGGLRWHLLSKKFDSIKLNFTASILEYWISLTLGTIGLGSLGSDAYRIALSGKQTGFYLRGGIVIGIEKISALLSCTTLIIGFYPFLDFVNLPEFIIHIIDFSYYILIGFATIFIFFLIIHKTKWYERLIEKIYKKTIDSVNNVKKNIGRKNLIKSNNDTISYEAFRLILKPTILGPSLLLSFSIHLIGAIQSQLFFQALGYDLPFLVNVFVSPLILLVFTLPISVGSFGIREGTFILFYGAFGVPAEIALLVSFCGLLCVLTGHAVGSVLIFTRRGKTDNWKKITQ